jgi:hypothetical protein
MLFFRKPVFPKAMDVQENVTGVLVWIFDVDGRVSARGGCVNEWSGRIG